MRKQNKQKTSEQNEATVNTPHDRTHTRRCGGSRRKGHMMQNSHRKGGPGHRRGKRPLGHGDLGLLILSLIQETPRHGYDLITQIETRTGGAYKPSPGVMYPALEVLQDIGHAEVVLEGTKKTYRITDDGQATLTDKSDDLEKITTRLEHLASPEKAPETSTVRSAVQRLHHAVKSQMSAEAVSPENRDAILVILEEARQKIAALQET